MDSAICQCPACYTAPGADAHSLQRPCCAALVEKLKAARNESHKNWEIGFDTRDVEKRLISAGKLEAFNAVLMWIREAQHNDRTHAPRK